MENLGKNWHVQKLTLMEFHTTLQMKQNSLIYPSIYFKISYFSWVYMTNLLTNILKSWKCGHLQPFNTDDLHFSWIQ